MHHSAVKQIGLDKYIKGVSTLFDPSSQVDLIRIDQVDDSTFKTRWRLAAKVNFPFKLTLKPYLGSSTYRVNQHHLIQSQTVRTPCDVLQYSVLNEVRHELTCCHLLKTIQGFEHASSAFDRNQSWQGTPP